jgi:Holliday junction DNA helicase RuvA
MIGYIEGNLFTLKTNYVIVNVNGVGYELGISLNTYSKMNGSNFVKLFVFTYVREDKIELYGFSDDKEKAAFEILIKTSGVGPRVAMSILSGLTTLELADAVRTNNINSLVKIPGIGRTKAQKILFELKNRFKGFDSEPSIPGNSIQNDALESLVALGFEEKKSLAIVKSILNESTELTLEDVLRKSLSKINA